MLERILVTTADKRSWPRGKPVTFLGNWCKLPAEKEAWTSLNADVTPYHWDNREKMHADYAYLNSCYENMLISLADALNIYHETNHGVRYWRILIGPWLYLFIHILFDRWVMIEQASNTGNITSTILLNDPEEELIPSNLLSLNIDDLRWNHFLYSCSIRNQAKIAWEELPGESHKSLIQRHIDEHKLNYFSFKRFLNKTMQAMLRYFVLPREVFCCATYMTRFQEIYLQLALKQIPKCWHIPLTPQVLPNLQIRHEFCSLIKTSIVDHFQKFLMQMVARQIPTAYLEGYASLTRVVKKVPWPMSPRVIFTSNAFQCHEVFQAWAADRVESGSSLVVGQHGGFYGIGKIVVGEEHQIKISDRFLTWGWKDSRPNLYPVGVLTNIGKTAKAWKSDGNLLLVTVPIRLLAFKCMSWPIAANQAELFFQNQVHFVSRLKNGIRAQLILRLKESLDRRFSSSLMAQWKALFPDITIDKSILPIEKQLLTSRLLIYAYNSTGYLEALARNIPTVIFWDHQYWELREDAIPFFESLSAAKIFFTSATDAADHINLIWSNVEDWWKSPMVQAAREQFCFQYAKQISSFIQVMRNALNFS